MPKAQICRGPPDPYQSSAMDPLGLKSPPRPPDLIAMPIDGSKMVGMHKKIGRNKSYSTSDPLNGDNKYTANDICKMIEYLVDNIYAWHSYGNKLCPIIG